MQSNFRARYKIESKIGEGSFAEVLKCKDKETGKYLAAKQLKKKFRSAQHAFETPELVAMRKLSGHPNILHLIESHFDPLTGKLTMIFDLMNSSLYDTIKNRKLPLTEAKSKNYLYQIIQGIQHIHNYGIFHRDIKPENILVKDELLKISDLGSIKGILSRHPYTEYISTRWYRSPECLLTTGYYGPKMDVWAIGCVFYELLTLKPLFPGSSEIDQIAKINSVLGTPSTRLLAKFKKHKSRNIANFAPKQGTGLNTLMPPLTTEAGRDILKQMLIYDPDQRIHVRRLSDHRYFQDYKDLEAQQKAMVNASSIRPVHASSSSTITQALNNPALLSYLTNDHRRRKTAVKLKKKKLAPKQETNGMVKKRIISTPVRNSTLKAEEKRLQVAPRAAAITRSLARMTNPPQANGPTALKTSSTSALDSTVSNTGCLLGELEKPSLTRPLIQMLMRVAGAKADTQSKSGLKPLENDLAAKRRTKISGKIIVLFFAQ
ncbi:Hypothetical protein NTJ_05989 [Nesidiocoris tenuis]|uniref:Protein kinase domain-containing protein n=1 Tax=Nesidiocoris tenuis TaxID=355587 RepID=A0ABN7AQI6_9HEMI|nr:Hypothetical protein NTJ_05989 [Nesidiocoris tenuis]